MRRSALGIRRIKDVDVSQVLHATEADIHHLRNKLQSWGVTTFNNYPLLLRALTHPSISNWVERVLNLPKRSLGPNTLELLGDRVVGTAVAFHALQWRKENKFAVRWHRGRPTGLVKSLVGNRGMAMVASEVGIDELIRWEKGIPPVTHRERLSCTGVDEVTGILSNVQINALASAYEAVTAAIYLDGGFPVVEKFVNNTLLRDAASLQAANVDVTEYEEMLLREIENMIRSSVSFIVTRRRDGRCSSKPIKSFEKVQCEILDLESTTPYNEAHRVYYSGIALRAMSRVDNEIREEDLLYVSSHFSVENARIAALTGALETLRGERKARVSCGDGKNSREKLQMREIVFGSGGGKTDIGLRGDGGWWLDGDYTHVVKVLESVGGVGMDGLRDFHSGDVREVFRERYEARKSGDDDTVERRVYKRNEIIDAGFPRRERGIGEAAVCVDSIGKCLDIGMEIESSRRLTREHRGLQEVIGTADDISMGISRRLDDVRNYGMEERSLLMKSYHALGHNVMRLWGVQRSMSDICDDRSVIIGECEHRGSLGPRVEKVMMGDGLGEIGDLRARKVFVGLGMCVEQVGLGSAITWLSGAEERLKESL